MMTVVSPSLTSRLKPLRTFFGPKALWTSTSRIIAAKLAPWRRGEKERGTEDGRCQNTDFRIQKRPRGATRSPCIHLNSEICILTSAISVFQIMQQSSPERDQLRLRA